MEQIVCYDIADNRRRDRVAKALLDFGARIQESVFVAHLDEDLTKRMVTRMEGLIDAESDRLHIFELCGACAARTRTMGNAEVPEEQDFYVI